MFNLKNLEPDIVPPDIEERFDKLSKEKQEDFFELFADKMASKALELDTNDHMSIDDAIKEIMIEAMDEIEGKVDNWKNGLDLL